MTTDALVAMAQEVHTRWPEARLKKNAMGNLIVVCLNGELVAWLDLMDGTVNPY